MVINNWYFNCKTNKRNVKNVEVSTKRNSAFSEFISGLYYEVAVGGGEKSCENCVVNSDYNTQFIIIRSIMIVDTRI